MNDTNQIRLFEDAVREHGGMVARIASTYEARPALAEELVQEAFSAFWRALPSVRSEASLKSFLARITHNVCVSHVRRDSRTIDVELSDKMVSPTAGPEEEAARNLNRERLLRAVRDLPIGQRQVITLHLEGFTDKEVADALGLTEGNVSVRLSRARVRLKEFLGGAQ